MESIRFRDGLALVHRSLRHHRWFVRTLVLLFVVPSTDSNSAFFAFAEILVDVVDVVLEGSGIDEKFLGITIFALVPNTTEFMNAMSFALNGNIALS